MKLDLRVGVLISSRVDSALGATCCERGVSQGLLKSTEGWIDKREHRNISEEEVMDLGDQSMKGNGEWEKSGHWDT